jgi:hypothetical protein
VDEERREWIEDLGNSKSHHDCRKPHEEVDILVSCNSCGGEIDSGETECPYCGASIIQKATAHIGSIGTTDETYGSQIDDEGHTFIRFGDGETGARLSTGDVSTHYRQGAGTQGNDQAQQVEEKLDRAAKHLDRIPDPSKHKGSKDLGLALIESMSSLGNLLSVYQSTASSEAHLSTEDHDRISTKEKRIRPKLEGMIKFCDTVDSKKMKRMGLSDGDIHRIRTTATRALQMSESRTGKCTKCGTRNRPGSGHCQNCGASI